MLVHCGGYWMDSTTPEHCSRIIGQYDVSRVSLHNATCIKIFIYTVAENLVNVMSFYCTLHVCG